MHIHIPANLFARSRFRRVLIAIVLITPCMGQGVPLTRIVDSLPGADEEIQRLHEQLLSHNADRQYDLAIETGRAIVERIEGTGAIATDALCNLSLLQAAAGNLPAAVDTLDEAIDGVTVQHTDTHPSLIRPLQTKGLLLRLMGRLDEATDALRQAQNIVHRMDGVYSVEQRDILQQLTLINLQARQFDLAVRHQKYDLINHTIELGEGNPELLHHTHSHALFLANLGHFKESVKLLKSVVDDLEGIHGKDSLYLVQPLQSIARVKMLEREIKRYSAAVPALGPDTDWIQPALGSTFFLTEPVSTAKQQPVQLRVSEPLNMRTEDEPPPLANRPPVAAAQQSPVRPVKTGDQELYLASNTTFTNSVGVVDKLSYKIARVEPYMRDAIKTLQRVTDIMDKEPSANPSDRIRALVELGDIYAVTGSGNKSHEAYLRAWELIEAEPDPGVLQKAFFGAPLRIAPRELPALPLKRKPFGQEYEATLSFDVTSEGQVVNISVQDANVPTDALQKFKRRAFLYHYRPRIENGEPVLTEGLTLTQRYFGSGG